MEYWTAFILGAVGSLHCAGMCGPLALALPVTGQTASAYLLGRAAYNLGRIGTYAALGALFGGLGHTLALAGWQRWVSLGAGIAVLAGLFVSSRYAMNLPIWQWVGWLKSRLAQLLQRRSLAALLLLGTLNGLLPCGLVYVAGAGALAAGSVISGAASMIAFGLGTVPMMLVVSLAGKRLQLALRFKWQKLIPAFAVIMAAMLILRGLSLGIPYLSPALSAVGDPHARCH